ncbi:MAG: hypothetical protein CMA27_06325 [Euryarchaeota archaeon]|mgnify:FL=1|nr:hypothetical protein [Euryarchaeota archaeon]
MNPKQARISIILVLVLCSGLVFIFPTEPVLTTEVLFDDKVVQRIEDESNYLDENKLILIIKHDDNGPLTNNLTRVKTLLSLEQDIINNKDNIAFLNDNSAYIDTVSSPLNKWSDAFNSRNRSLENATKWADVLQPILADGWCGENTTSEEKLAFQSTLLLLPNEAKMNVACPAFSGSSASQAPQSNELIWLISLKDINDLYGDVRWSMVLSWAEKISEESEFEIEPAGVNMLFAKAQKIAEDDLSSILIPSLLFLILILTIGLQDWKISLVTIGSVTLIILAELGILSAIGFTISIIDVIAIPIIMGVAVDGAFWYCKSSRKREEVRSMLLIAMITTVSAISLSLISPIRAQRSLAFVMIIGIILDWVVTRFLLENFYLSKRKYFENLTIKKSFDNKTPMFWPIALVILASISIISPTSVDILDVKQFLPNDDPSLDDLDELQSKYLLASGTMAWIIIDAEGDSTTDLIKIQNFQKQLSYHPSIISIDTGIYQTPLIMGVPNYDGGMENVTINKILNEFEDSFIHSNPKLQKDGVTTGIAISVLIDGSFADAALEFSDDVRFLMNENELNGDVGGQLISGAQLAKDFGENRVYQILFAGIAVFIVSFALLRSPIRASRIAVGTIAIGAAVDGMASIIGTRGVHTAPAVLLGMGFAADYLSHASGEHPSTKHDNYARWGAAISSISIFLLLGFSVFPPAQNTGRLLTISILFAAILATCLSLTYIEKGEEE